MRGRAQLIAAILRHAGITVRSILDAGCGIGLLRKPFAEACRGPVMKAGDKRTTYAPIPMDQVPW